MQQLTTQEFKEAIKSQNKPAAIMVTASWCNNCKALAPVFKQTGDELKDIANFNYLKVDDNQALVKSLKIMGVPTMLFYRHGILIAKKVGNQSPALIKKVVVSLIDLSPEEATAKKYRSFLNKLFGKK